MGAFKYTKAVEIMHPEYIDWDREDLTNENFGSLKVEFFVGAKMNTCTHDTIWACRCDCGRWGYVMASDLRCRRVTSCGCQSENKVDRFMFDQELTEMNEK